MNRRSVVSVVSAVLVLSSSWTWAGRPDKNWKKWFGHFGVGYSLAQGTAGDIIDDDWFINGGATYWPEEWPLGIQLDLGYSSYNFSSEAIRFINDQVLDQPGSVTGGDLDIWQLNANAVWGPRTSGAVGFYLIGGVGAYYLDGRLTAPGIVFWPPTCSPWWWWCFPGGVGPGTIVKGSESTTEFGWNAGVGLDFNLNSGSQIYIEAKYTSVDTAREATEYVPVTIGYRW